MIRKGIIALVIAIVLGGGRRVVNKIKPQKVAVAVAQRDLESRTIIDDTMLDIEWIDVNVKNKNKLVEQDSIIGKVVKANHSILKGEYLRSDQLEQFDDAVDAPSLLLSQYERLYSLKVDVVSGGGMQRGSRVDVALRGSKDEISRILLENVHVVGVKNRQGVEVTDKEIPYVAYLAIHEDRIEELLEVEKNGKIVLLVRGADHD